MPPPARTRTAVAPPPQAAAPETASASAGGYLVQLSSQRSEGEAQSSYRALQAKFPNELGSRPPVIRRADLGSKGVYLSDHGGAVPIGAGGEPVLRELQGRRRPVRRPEQLSVA